MGYRNYGPANGFVVSKDGNGDFTTIATALTAATSGTTIFLKPGTYTENPTLVAGVNIAAWGSDASLNATGDVIINGNCTLSGAGSVTISGIQLQTNSAALLTVSGSAASIVNLENCFLNCSTTTGITFSTSSGSAFVRLYNCRGDLGTTGIGVYAHSSGGTLEIYSSYFTNSGASTTASTQSAGTMRIRNCLFLNGLTTSGSTALFDIQFTKFNLTNTTSITHGSTNATASTLIHSSCYSGTASAISVSASALLTVSHILVDSSNTNAITGAGTINYSCVTFTGTSATMNTTTQSGGLISGGAFQAPSAGYIGEHISSANTGVAFSNNTAKTVVSIALTAGIWDIQANCIVQYSVACTGLSEAGISTTNNVFEGNVGDQIVQAVIGAAAATTQVSLTISTYRLVTTTSKTMYLIGLGTFASGSGAFAGKITATRAG